MNYEYCDGITHTIRKGDTLYEISREHHVPLSMLLRANPYVDVFNLQVGDTICVPAKKPLEKPFLTPRPPRREMTGNMDRGDVMPQTASENNMSERNATEMPQDANATDTTERNATAMSQGVNATDMPDRNATAMPRDTNATGTTDRNATAMSQTTNTNNTTKRDGTVMPQSTSTANRSDTAWKKYVVKPGDTLFDILQGANDQVLAFVDKNGLANMYMLPGVAYYIPDTKNSSGTMDR